MKKYSAYKDSGIEWIGEIPKHWEVNRLRFLCEILPSNIDKKTKDDERSVLLCNYVDVYKNDFISRDMDFMPATASEIQIEKFTLKKNDIIATKDSEDPNDIGVPALVLENLNGVVCGYHLTVFRSYRSSEFGRYLFWFLKSKMCSQYFSTLARGITRYALGTSVFKNLSIPFIENVSELVGIANYLDRKTSEIETLILNKQRLIELLKEERTALINHAVTKGINPDVKLKPSGVEWIGDVPEHWEVKPLKYLGTTQNGISEGAEYFGSGFPFVSYGDVYKNIELPKIVQGLANSTGKDKLNFSVQKGDVFFTRTSETIEEIGLASTCFETIDNAVFAGFLIRFRPFKNLLFEGFSKYYFRSEIHRTFFIKEMNIVTRASLSQGLLKRLLVLLPDLKEQKEISDFLDVKTKGIDTIISKTEKEIELLNEYKTALISEVVTGKVDVREEVLV